MKQNLKNNWRGYMILLGGAMSIVSYSSLAYMAGLGRVCVGDEVEIFARGVAAGSSR